MSSLALRLLGSAASTVDRAVVAAFGMGDRRGRSAVAALSHEEKLVRLAQVRDTYGTARFVADADAYFVPPPRLVPRERRVRDLPWGGECLELSWESAFEPLHVPVRDKYLAYAHNRTAHARFYGTRKASRPAVIVVHGYMQGQWAIEERMWPIRWMNARGLDVAVAVLPFHGVRARPEGGAPPFPGSDPRMANEGFRQVVADLRVLAAVLRERGAPSVGVMGMSLGGYSVSLLATVEPDLAFVVPMIPLASIADSARDQGRLGSGESANELHAALEAAYRVVSPFARPSLVPKERILVIGAEDDRVTPIGHAERLAKHFDAPLLRLHGGHILQTWRGPAFRAVKTMWRRNTIV